MSGRLRSCLPPLVTSLLPEISDCILTSQFTSVFLLLLSFESNETHKHTLGAKDSALMLKRVVRIVTTMLYGSDS
jgi:hypothetical protein